MITSDTSIANAEKLFGLPKQHETPRDYAEAFNYNVRALKALHLNLTARIADGSGATNREFREMLIKQHKLCKEAIQLRPIETNGNVATHCHQKADNNKPAIPKPHYNKI